MFARKEQPSVLPLPVDDNVVTHCRSAHGVPEEADALPSSPASRGGTGRSFPRLHTAQNCFSIVAVFVFLTAHALSSLSSVVVCATSEWPTVRSANSITGKVHREFDPSHSFVLTGDAFQTQVLTDAGKNSSFWFVSFIVPWCSHCEALKPEFEKASKLRTLYPAVDEPRVQFVSVDCTAEKKLCLDHKVDLLPTLRLYHHGKNVHEYANLSRKAQDFLEYLKRMTKPPVTELRTPAQLREVLQREQIAFLLMLKADQTVPTVFEKVASLYFDQHVFGVIRIDELHTGLEIEDVPPPYVVDVGPDVMGEPYTGPWENDKDLLDFVKTNRFHVVEEITRFSFDILRKSDRIIVALVVDLYAPDFHELTEQLYQISLAWRPRNKYIFGYWNGDEYEKLLQRFDIYRSELPRVIAFKPFSETSDVQYYYEDAKKLTLDNLDAGLAMILSGELNPKADTHTRSQAVRQFLLGHWKRLLAFCEASWRNVALVCVSILVMVATLVLFLHSLWSVLSRSKEGNWEELEEEEDSGSDADQSRQTEPTEEQGEELRKRQPAPADSGNAPD